MTNPAQSAPHMMWQLHVQKKKTTPGTVSRMLAALERADT